MNDATDPSDEKLDSLLWTWANARASDSSGDQELFRAITAAVCQPRVASSPQVVDDLPAYSQSSVSQKPNGPTAKGVAEADRDQRTETARYP